LAGYSKRPLAEKLGIKAGIRMIILNPPPEYDETLGVLPEGVRTVRQLRGPLDFIHYFTSSRSELEKRITKFKQALDWNGAFWVSWPKVSSGVPTDLNENIVREIAVKNGLVDIKVCAVDEVWSGLKLVYRLKDRK
jgi:hypothetical protein